MTDDDDLDLDDSEPAAAELEPQIIAWQEVPLPPLPATWGPVVVTITPTELWCPVCGSDGGIATPRTGFYKSSAELKPACFRCGARRLVLAAEVLKPVEYRLR